MSIILEHTGSGQGLGPALCVLLTHSLEIELLGPSLQHHLHFCEQQQAHSCWYLEGGASKMLHLLHYCSSNYNMHGDAAD